MVTLRRSLWVAVWDVPRAAGAGPVGRPDHLLAAGVAVVVLVEGLVRPDLTWRPLVTVLALALAPALLWRRDHPLAAAVLGWGVAGLLAVLQLATGVRDAGLDSMTAVLVLLFALVRWGSGREVVLGAAFVAVVVALGTVAAAVAPSTAFAGAVLVLLVAALGAVSRSRADLGDRRRREVRNAERAALARELHDTVAHHVSAIAVQAQAGGVVARLRPDQAAEVLATIESEASYTLAEMRSMVRVLREDDVLTPAPPRGVADLPDLARPGTAPAVEVSLVGPPTPLPGAVDATVYRLAQESVTNAVRHARGATRVAIEVHRDGDVVRLRVTDDGTPAPAPQPGFGLLGMRERVHLLGGTFTAGPGRDGGWVVEAVLPVAVPG